MERLSTLWPRIGYFGFSLAIYLLDQSTKLWAWRVLRFLPEQTIPVLDGCFSFTYAINPGIAFSVFGNSGSQMRWILLTTAMIAAGGVFIYAWLTPLTEHFQLSALSLIFGGIIGNASDRIVYGAVIDFLDVYVSSYHWPIFNIADSAICIGVGLLILHVLRDERTAAEPIKAQQ